VCIEAAAPAAGGAAAPQRAPLSRTRSSRSFTPQSVLIFGEPGSAVAARTAAAIVAAARTLALGEHLLSVEVIGSADEASRRLRLNPGEPARLAFADLSSAAATAAVVRLRVDEAWAAGGAARRGDAAAAAAAPPPPLPPLPVVAVASDARAGFEAASAAASASRLMFDDVTVAAPELAPSKVGRSV